MPRLLTPDEKKKLNEKVSRIFKKSVDEGLKLYDKAWQMVDENPVCLDCGYRAKNLKGLRIHTARLYWKNKHRNLCLDVVLRDYYLAVLLGIIKKEGGECHG